MKSFHRINSRQCPQGPTVISDADVAAAEAAGKVVMRYPKTNEEGFIPRNYICNHETAIYPGLMKNPFPENNELVQYLPCCYKKNHASRDKRGGYYRHYFFGENLTVGLSRGQKRNCYRQICRHGFVRCSSE